jgi:hypothetical protein
LQIIVGKIAVGLLGFAFQLIPIAFKFKFVHDMRFMKCIKNCASVEM